MNYSVVIIGSGLGGLEVALGLAKKGMRVLVLERQKHPGGCMQSYHRGSLRLDTGLHYIGGLADGGSLREDFEAYGLMQLPWHRMDDECFEEIHLGGRVYRWKMGMDSFIGEMKSCFPNEAEGLDKFRDMLLSTDDEWLMNTSCWKYLEDTFHDKTLIEVLSAPAMCKMELNTETLPLFTYQHGIEPFIESSWRLKGDGNQIVECLVSQIKANGGDVLTHKEVVELKESEGRLVEAVTADGCTYRADWFVSDTHPGVTCSLVRESQLMKKIFRNRMNHQANTRGMFTVQLKVKTGSLKYFNHNKIVLTAPTWDYSVGRDLEVKNIMISCRVPESADSTYAENIDILTPMDWSAVEEYADSQLHHRPEGYQDMKNKVTEACISLAEEAIPGLKDMIEEVWTSSPLTYRDYNCTPEGSAFGFRKDYNNPLMTVISPKTPIPNLLMTGQSLMLHGLMGVTRTAGYTLAAIES